MNYQDIVAARVRGFFYMLCAIPATVGVTSCIVDDNYFMGAAGIVISVAAGSVVMFVSKSLSNGR